MATVKAGDVLVHEWDRHIVLIVRVSEEWMGRDGSTLYDALVLDKGKSWCEAGTMLVLNGAGPFHEFSSDLSRPL